MFTGTPSSARWSLSSVNRCVVTEIIYKTFSGSFSLHDPPPPPMQGHEINYNYVPNMYNYKSCFIFG